MFDPATIGLITGATIAIISFIFGVKHGQQMRQHEFQAMNATLGMATVTMKSMLEHIKELEDVRNQEG